MRQRQDGGSIPGESVHATPTLCKPSCHVSPCKGTRSHWAWNPCGGTDDRDGQASGPCSVVHMNAADNNLGIGDVGTDALWPAPHADRLWQN